MGSWLLSLFAAAIALSTPFVTGWALRVIATKHERREEVKRLILDITRQVGQYRKAWSRNALFDYCASTSNEALKTTLPAYKAVMFQDAQGAALRGMEAHEEQHGCALDLTTSGRAALLIFGKDGAELGKLFERLCAMGANYTIKRLDRLEQSEKFLHENTAVLIDRELQRLWEIADRTPEWYFIQRWNQATASVNRAKNAAIRTAKNWHRSGARIVKRIRDLRKKDPPSPV
ncbi:MAG: hypothetical protein SGJ19_05110 [Planctomycetia bacterium]|nr:hypothetical protein [Planctomycetia bacterium]